MPAIVRSVYHVLARVRIYRDLFHSANWPDQGFGSASPEEKEVHQ